ncbi:MAG: hypothetical protein E7292_09520 [Lachnospiraceae bacterium]|nr:hypothetical protein [Lachnospiraceae bacterium]
MIKRFLLTTVLASTLIFSGCGMKGNLVADVFNQFAERTDVSETVEVESTEESTASSESSQEEIAGEPVKENGEDVVTAGSIPEESIKETGTSEITENTDSQSGTRLRDTILGQCLVGDGYITNDRDVIREALEQASLVEKDVSMEDMLSGNMENGKQKVYHFKIKHHESAGKMPTESGANRYITTMVHGADTYVVYFGMDDKYTLDEVKNYCTKGMEVEYWAFATASDNVALVIPFIAGSEENGYYLVAPSMAEMGADVSALTVPSIPVGNPMDSSGTENNTATPKGDDTTNGNATNPVAEDAGKIALDVNSVENSDYITVLNCTYTNDLDTDICLIGEALYINGVDYSDKFSAYAEVKNCNKYSGEMYVDDVQLKAGDKLEFIFEVSDNNTYKQLGKIKFEMVLAAN